MHIHKEIPVQTIARVKSDALDLAARAITGASAVNGADKAEVAARLHKYAPSFVRDLALEATQPGLGATVTVDDAASRLQNTFDFIARTAGDDTLGMGAAEVALSKSQGERIVALMILGAQDRVIGDEFKIHELALSGAA